MKINDELLHLRIINSEKKENWKKSKLKVGKIHSLILGLFILGVCLNDSIFQIPFPIIGVIMLFLSIGSALLIAFVYIKGPSKGRLLFYEDYFTILNKKTKYLVKISELAKVNFYFEDNKYSLGIIKKDGESIWELDIVFGHEKQKLNEIIDKWKNKGFLVEVIHSQASTTKTLHFEKFIDETSNSKNNFDFTKFKIKIYPGLTFKVKSKIPLTKLSSKELIVIASESFEYNAWPIIKLKENRIESITDNIFPFLANRIMIDFIDNFMIISVEDYRKGIIPLGAKNQIRILLETMTLLGNNFDKEILLKKYGELL